MPLFQGRSARNDMVLPPAPEPTLEDRLHTAERRKQDGEALASQAANLLESSAEDLDIVAAEFSAEAARLARLANNASALRDDAATEAASVRGGVAPTS